MNESHFYPLTLLSPAAAKSAPLSGVKDYILFLVGFIDQASRNTFAVRLDIPEDLN
jgi:hypothetical protein